MMCGWIRVSNLQGGGIRKEKSAPPYPTDVHSAHTDLAIKVLPKAMFLVKSETLKGDLTCRMLLWVMTTCQPPT